MLWHKVQGAGGLVVAGGGGPSIIQYAVGGLSSDPSVTTPSGLSNGNLLVFTGAIAANSWDQLDTDLSNQGLTLQSTFEDSSQATNPSVFIATRVINGSEASSYSLTESADGRVVLMEVSGTLDVCGVSGKDASALTYNISSITTTGANRLLIAVGGIGNNDTLTMPTGMTELFNTSSDNLDPTIAVAYEAVGSGATGTRQISRTSSTGGLGGVMFAVY